MPISKTKKAVYLDKETVEQFEYIYPQILTLFLNRALKVCTQDKKEFENIFFNNSFIEVK